MFVRFLLWLVRKQVAKQVYDRECEVRGELLATYRVRLDEEFHRGQAYEQAQLQQRIDKAKDDGYTQGYAAGQQDAKAMMRPTKKPACKRAKKK